MSDYSYTGDTEEHRLPRAEVGGCALVQDLIPLYLDNEVSPDSHVLIAEHVQHCERCSGYLAGARTVRAQILNEQQTIRAAGAARPNVAQVQQPVASSFGVALWQSLMGLLYVGGLLLGFIGFAEPAPAAVGLGGLTVIGALAGLLIVGSARTQSWRVLMLLTGAIGLLFSFVAFVNDPGRWEAIAVYGFGMIVLSAWGVWLHGTQQAPPEGSPTQRTRQGARRAMLTAILSVLGSLACGLLALAGLLFVIQGLRYGQPDTLLPGALFLAVGGGGIMAINYRRGWFTALFKPQHAHTLIGWGMLLLGTLILLATLPAGSVIGLPWLPAIAGAALVFVGLRLLQAPTRPAPDQE